LEIYTPGAAEYLQVCLAQINGAPAYACAFEPVNECVARMYNATCPSQAAADTCQLIEYALCGTNEPFDVTGCTDELKPLDGSALEWVEACVASSGEPGCQTAYRSCFDQITSY
jgi:hypothetical protein